MTPSPRPLPPELGDALADASPDDRAALARVWGVLGEPPAPPADADARRDAAWAALAADLGLPRSAEPAPPPEPARRAAPPRAADRVPARRAPARRWAAAVFGLTAVAVAAWGLDAGLGRWTAPQSVVAPRGASARVALADGSTVELAAGARLSWRRHWGARPLAVPAARAVTLDGEAFFAVARGAAPFVVRTHNAEVAVLGTRFNVRAWRGERATTVTLEEGRVRVAAGGRRVVLAPGQATLVGGAAGVPTDAPTATPTAPAPAAGGRATAWRGGGLALSRVPLGAAFDEVERRFAVDVAPAAGLDLDAPVTAFYPGRTDARTVLADLCAAHGLRFRASSRGFFVF